jgi:hypothetical protein
MCARKVFYVFVKTSDKDQFCAIRQDQPIPSMLDGVSWEYVDCIEVTRTKPLGFHAEDAQEATRSQGIYFYRREFAFARGSLMAAA